MKTILTLLLAVGMLSFSYAQDTIEARELTKKEIKKLQKEKRKKEREANENSMYNEYKVDVNAPTVARAIRWYLGSAQIKGQYVILRSNDSMNTASPYAVWDVDGAVRQTPPTELNLNTIRKVKVLRSLSETNKYGFLGASGVIVIQTTSTYKE